MPDCTISRIPYGSSTLSSASSLSAVPVASIVTASGRRRRPWPGTGSHDLEHLRCGIAASARTLTSSSSRCTDWRRVELDDLEDVDQLVELLGDLLERQLVDVTTIVIRETSGCSVGPTASDSMLKPRRLNSPATRASTPGLFSTSTDRVCLVMSSALDLVPDRAGRRGRPGSRRCSCRPATIGHTMRVLADDEVDDHRRVVDRHRLLDRRVHVVLASRSAARRSPAPRPA